MDCATLQERFGMPFLEQEDDLIKAKRIVALGLAYKCKDLSVFLKAAKVVQRHAPDFGLAKLIAILSDAREEYDTADHYYLEAKSLTHDPMKKAEINYALALHYRRRDTKTLARNHALQAAKVDQYRRDAYKLIGDLYFSSSEDCKEGTSIVRDRAVYMAAYEMYKKAGHTEMMEAARAQFPTREEIFQETYTEGQVVKVGCWINENVKIQCRPEQQ
jgi:tetratricopeptide (TPR) repeat protein